MGAVLIFLLILLLGMVFQEVGTWYDSRQFPPPGELITVNGMQMHIYCTGEGSPTVILETLSGGTSSYWGWVQPEIAKSTRVCAYDRAGHGWSESGDAPADLWGTADNLYNLLQGAEVDGPYILVGHSIGGLYTRAYIENHGDEVAGLVLLDASHPEQFERYPEMLKETESYQNIARFFPILARIGLFRLYFYLGGEIDFADLAPRQHDEVAAQWSSPSYFESQYAEILAIPEIYSQAVELGSLGNLPLSVISAGTNTSNGWPDLQEDLATLSSNVEHVIVPDASHGSLVFNPDHARQVSGVILQMLQDSQ